MKWRLDEGQIEVVDEAVAAVLRKMTPAQRIEMALAANRTVRLRIAGHLQTLHPDWDKQAIEAEVARRMLVGTDDLPQNLVMPHLQGKQCLPSCCAPSPSQSQAVDGRNMAANDGRHATQN